MNYYKKDNSYIASDLPLDLPTVTAEEYNTFITQQTTKRNLLAKLEEVDSKSLRSLRAITSGVGAQEDIDRLAELEEQAQDLRKKLNQLEVVQ